jgi:hypothetical protein
MSGTQPLLNVYDRDLEIIIDSVRLLTLSAVSGPFWVLNSDDNCRGTLSASTTSTEALIR